MSQEHYVIIGNGAAGNSAAAFIRDTDKNNPITLISDEFALYYYRHRLPSFIAGDIPENRIYVHPASYYKSRSIRLRLGQPVQKIDFSERSIFLKHMEKINYSKLVLCLGGKPRIPEIHYTYQKTFTTMKTLEDARKLKELLSFVRSVFIVGGDLISVRLAEALMRKGISVFFLVDTESFWPLTTTPGMLSDFEKTMQARGVSVILNDTIRNITKLDDNRYRVEFKEHAQIECDLVGGFFGLTPDVDFLARSGLDIDRGILVNEFLETAMTGVYAAGDCAQVYNPDIRNYWVSIGWHNAIRLGELAARNLLGSHQAASEPPASVMSFQGIEIKTGWWKDLS